MGQIKFIAGVFLTVVFAVSILSFMTTFADRNNAVVSIENDSRLTDLNTDIQGDVITFKGSVNSSSKSFADSTIESGDETTVTGGVFKSFTSPFTSVKNILSVGTSVIFGDNQGSSGFGIVLTALMSFFVIVLALYIWKTWAGKNPD